jgi:hypothetical protein
MRTARSRQFLRRAKHVTRIPRSLDRKYVSGGNAHDTVRHLDDDHRLFFTYDCSAKGKSRAKEERVRIDLSGKPQSTQQ